MDRSIKNIRVLIADDHTMVRAGIAALLSNQEDIEVIGEAADGLQALEKVRDLKPDIVVLDINMPAMSGFEATYQITRNKQSTKVLILSQHEEEEYIKRVVQAGAHGYLLKNSLAEELPLAIRSIMNGDKYFTKSVSKIMFDAFAKPLPAARDESPLHLTPREREILLFIADGYTNQKIADKLFISPRTVEFHRANLTEKLGIKDVAGLVKYAISIKAIQVTPAEGDK